MAPTSGTPPKPERRDKNRLPIIEATRYEAMQSGGLDATEAARLQEQIQEIEEAIITAREVLAAQKQAQRAYRLETRYRDLANIWYGLNNANADTIKDDYLPTLNKLLPVRGKGENSTSGVISEELTESDGAFYRDDPIVQRFQQQFSKKLQEKKIDLGVQSVPEILLQFGELVREKANLQLGKKTGIRGVLGRGFKSSRLGATLTGMATAALTNNPIAGLGVGLLMDAFGSGGADNATKSLKGSIFAQQAKFNDDRYSRRLAKGGIVTSPVNAIIGEQGPEAVIPLNAVGMGDRFKPVPETNRGGLGGALRSMVALASSTEKTQAILVKIQVQGQHTNRLLGDMLKIQKDALLVAKFSAEETASEAKKTASRLASIEKSTGAEAPGATPEGGGDGLLGGLGSLLGPAARLLMGAGGKLLGAGKGLAGKLGAKVLGRKAATTVAGAAAAGAGKKLGARAARRAATAAAKKAATEAAVKGAGKGIGKGLLKSAAKKIPFGIGALISGGFAANRLWNGDYVGAGLEAASGLASIVPGAGTAAAIGLDALGIGRDVKNEMAAEETPTETPDTPTSTDPLPVRVVNAPTMSPTAPAFETILTDILVEHRKTNEILTANREAESFKQKEQEQEQAGTTTMMAEGKVAQPKGFMESMLDGLLSVGKFTPLGMLASAAGIMPTGQGIIDTVTSAASGITNMFTGGAPTNLPMPTGPLGKDEQAYRERLDADTKGMRQGDTQAHRGGRSHLATLMFADTARSLIKSSGKGTFDRFTGFNDAYHAGTRSKHAQGLAFDFTLKGGKSEAVGVVSMMREFARKHQITADILDEYNQPSAHATAGHIHVEFNNTSDADKFVSMMQLMNAGGTANATPGPIEPIPLSNKMAAGGTVTASPAGIPTMAPPSTSIPPTASYSGDVVAQGRVSLTPGLSNPMASPRATAPVIINSPTHNIVGGRGGGGGPQNVFIEQPGFNNETTISRYLQIAPSH